MNPPCRCERLSFPHRFSWQCEDFEAEQRDLQLQDTPEDCVDGTTTDIINWMRNVR